eukprot:12311.XXX_656484_656636_1 [CDS] Oithona nana genome sequencing.
MTISVYPPSLEIFIPSMECDNIKVIPKTTKIDFDTCHIFVLQWNSPFGVD